MRKILSVLLLACLISCLASAALTDHYVFSMSDGTDAVFAEGDYEAESRISDPGEPARDGYFFAGWFSDEAFADAYNKLKKYSGDVVFTAKWLKMYTFEAEKTQLTDLDPDEDDTCNVVGQKLGQSYSGNVAGSGLINGCACEASGDAYVTNLYYNGAFIEFVINSDKAVDDALLFLRLSGEFTTISLTDKTFVVTVNDEAIAYGAIELVGGTTDDLTSASRRAMSNHGMGAISLKAGENVIRLTVNNSEKQFATGTMDAAAPMIDCIMIYADAGLTMEEFDN